MGRLQVFAAEFCFGRNLRFMCAKLNQNDAASCQESCSTLCTKEHARQGDLRILLLQPRAPALNLRSPCPTLIQVTLHEVCRCLRVNDITWLPSSPNGRIDQQQQLLRQRWSWSVFGTVPEHVAQVALSGIMPLRC